MWDPTPWVIGGGAEHSPEVARLLAYASTGGAEGVVEPTSCKVTATPTPGNTIRVAPGAVLVRNRFSGGAQQTYAARNAITHTKQVTATGSGGGRSDLVVARIYDPQYAGQAPSDPTDYQYVDTHIVTGVPAGTTTATELNLGYPAIALARIDIPANTATITNAMITDLRKVAIPRTLTRVLPASHPGPTEAIGPGMNDLRTVAYRPILVPEWATAVTVSASFSGIALDAASAQGFAVVEIAHTGVGEQVRVDENWTGSWHRFSLSAGGEERISPGNRGQSVELAWRLRHTSGSGVLRVDTSTSFLATVEFRETAD